MYDSPWPNGNRTSRVARVVPAVAHEEALAVADVPELAREVEVRGGVLEAHRDGLGESTRGVHRAVEHVGDRPIRRPGRRASPSRIAGTRSANGSSTTPPFESTTTVFGLTASTASSSSSCAAGRSQVVAVEALGLERGRQAEEEHGDVLRRGELDSGIREARRPSDPSIVKPCGVGHVVLAGVRRRSRRARCRGASG